MSLVDWKEPDRFDLEQKIKSLQKELTKAHELIEAINAVRAPELETLEWKATAAQLTKERDEGRRSQQADAEAFMADTIALERRILERERERDEALELLKAHEDLTDLDNKKALKQERETNRVTSEAMQLLKVKLEEVEHAQDENYEWGTARYEDCLKLEAKLVKAAEDANHWKEVQAKLVEAQRQYDRIDKRLFLTVRDLEQTMKEITDIALAATSAIDTRDVVNRLESVARKLNQRIVGPHTSQNKYSNKIDPKIREDLNVAAEKVRRELKKKEIEEAIIKAKEMGLYDQVDHLTSQVPVLDADEENDGQYK